MTQDSRNRDFVAGPDRSHNCWRWPFWLVALLLSSVVNTAAADTIVVPTDFSTIQEAIDAAVDGDEIRVRPGSYGDFDFLGKRIVIRSTGGVGRTSAGDVAAVRGESPETRLIGFSIRFLEVSSSATIEDASVGRITNNSGSPLLTNIEFQGAFIAGSPTFRNCRARWFVGAFAPLEIEGGTPSFHNCTFAGSIADVCPSMLIRSEARVLVTESIFRENSSDEFDETGAVCVDPSSTLVVVGTEFVDNGSFFDGGAAIFNAGAIYVYASEFKDNSAGRGGAIFNSEGATAHFYQPYSIETQL